MEADLNGLKLEPAYTEKSSSAKSWYKKWWFITILAIVVLWFGLPFVFQPLAEKYEQNQLSKLTNNNFNKPAELSLLETFDDPFKGYGDAPVVIVEFLDYQCPFCKEAYPIMKRVLSKYSETVTLIVRDFPLDSVHPEAVGSAVAANCAGAQGSFWEYHDALYDRQDKLGAQLYGELAQELKLDLNKFNNCLKSLAVRNEIGDDFDTGVKAGVIGTPTFFVNGQKVEGPLPFDLWEKIINLAIEQRFK